MSVILTVFVISVNEKNGNLNVTQHRSRAYLGAGSFPYKRFSTSETFIIGMKVRVYPNEG